MIRFIFKVASYGFIALLVAAFFTNPTREDFKQEVKTRLDEEFDKHLDNPTMALIVEEGKHFVANMSDKLVTRDNYFICSVYTVQLPTGDYRYLGLFRNFVPLQQDNPLKDVFSDEE